MNKTSIILVGAGVMAQDYTTILKAMNCNFQVIGRSKDTSDKFFKATGVEASTGGLEKYLPQMTKAPTHAIVSVSRECLSKVTCQLLEAGVKNILVEKPAGLNREEIDNILKFNNPNVFIGLNRRFYSSVIEAKRLIEKDGGVKSFNFEFTEWTHRMVEYATQKPPQVMQTWFLGNSVHVADLAFYLGGSPKQISTFKTGSDVDWHSSASIFAGAGISNKNALFSYQANWNAPGRWSVEILTDDSKYIFRPLEELHVQRKGNVTTEKIEIDDSLDKEFKPGLYLQVKKFLGGDTSDLCDINEYSLSFDHYINIAGY